MDLWPHQVFAFEKGLERIASGVRRIVITTPTGGGKTRVMEKLAHHYLGLSKYVSLYTDRKMLTEQVSRVMELASVDHGVRAAEYPDERERPFQISSLPTERSRVLKRKIWKLHPADLVLVDEGHRHNNPTAKEIMDRHIAEGAVIILFTATPLGMASIADELIIAGTPSELFQCGSLVRAVHYGPDEPDLRHIKKVVVGDDLSEAEQRKVMGAAGSPQIQQLFGRVLESFNKLNPDRKPTILFAPGVAESIWFAQEFNRNGIKSAHIDGDKIWIDGDLERSTRDLRQQVLEDSEHGRIQVICNRFVLREGVDAPWLAHGIFATVFGSLQSYLQAGGRLLRAHPDLAYVTIQDHGGNWHRHGSLNADRHWKLEYTGRIMSGMREQRMREKREREPLRCPQCSRILTSHRCPCGYEIQPGYHSRPVVQVNGSLKEMRGDIYRPRRISQRPDTEEIWKKMYYRCRNRGATFLQGEALFAYENNWGWPPRTLPLMPINDLDWYLPVNEVPRERLRQ